MTSGENIKNAVEVLLKTYTSVKKMMDHTCAIAGNAGYHLQSEKFLRYRSDPDVAGWLTSYMIILFQKETDAPCKSENGWNNGPIYAMEVNLSGSSQQDGLPALILSKFEYNNMEAWKSSSSPADYWGYHQPIDQAFSKNFTCVKSGAFSVFTPNTDKVCASYWGLKQVTSRSFLLMDITSDNLREKVFDTFDELASLN